MEEKILICEDSPEGVFTAIYEVYERQLQRAQVRIQTGEDENYRLFAEYIQIYTHVGKAIKVMRTLQQKFGEETYGALWMALATDDTEKAQAVFQTVKWGLEACRRGQANRIMDHLTDPNVRKVMELSRQTGNELCRMREFLRFQELEKGFLFAKIAPRDNVLAMLTPHFADRLPGENFVIYDEKRDLAAVHPAFGEWYLLNAASEMTEGADGEKTEKEKEYEALFQHFCDKISINERKNLKLQRNMLPLRYREYMTEFLPK